MRMVLFFFRNNFKKQYITLIAILILGESTAFAQSKSFWKVYDTPTEESFNSIIRIDSSSLLIAGGTDFINGDASLIKTDNNGAILWGYQYGLPKLESVVSVFKNDESHYYLFGTVSTGLTTVDTILPFLFVTDSAGGLLNSTYFTNDSSFGIRTIVRGGNDYYLIGGRGFSFSPNFGYYVPEGALTKLDSDGNIVWARNYFSDLPMTYTSFQAIDSNTFFAVGTVYDTLTENSSLLLTKMDSLGLPVWSKLLYDDVGFSYIHLLKLYNGDLLIACAIVDAPAVYFLVTRLDATGSIIWSKVLGGAGIANGYNLVFEDVKQQIILGQSKAILYLDQNGNQISMGDHIDNTIYSGPFNAAVSNSDSSVTLVGSVYDITGPIFNQKAILLKLGMDQMCDSVTSMIPIVNNYILQNDSFVVNSGSINLVPVSGAVQSNYNLTLLDYCDPVTTLNEIIENELLIYPNPVSDEFNIKLGEKSRLSDVRIFDMMGKLLNLSNHSNNFRLDVSDIPDGIYQVQVVIDHSTINKLFIKRKQ